MVRLDGVASNERQLEVYKTLPDSYKNVSLEILLAFSEMVSPQFSPGDMGVPDNFNPALP